MTPLRDAAESATAGVPVVRGLVWHKSAMTGWNGDYHTVPTAYSVRCADENGWKWSGIGGFGYEHSPESAQAAAQVAHDQYVRSALNPDYASELDTARAEIERLKKALAEAMPILKAVAHIGVDFGYGPYQVEEKFIQSSRAFLDAIAARATLSPAVKETK